MFRYQSGALVPDTNYRLLIVGGCGGIGRSLVEAALAHNIQVAVFDLPESLERHPPPQQVLRWSVDAVDYAQVECAMQGLAEEWSSLDGLVNLAGYMGALQPIEQLDPQHWQGIFEASFQSTLNACRAALPLLQKSERQAAIVNMSSGLGNVCNPGYGPYSSAKAAVVALTKTLAKEQAPSIRCNAVAPGGINTAFLTGGTGRAQSPARVKPQDYAELVPMKRLGEPEEVAGPIMFLLSDAASYITGQVLHIDGGALMPG